MSKHCDECKYCKTLFYTDYDGVWFAKVCDKKVIFKYFCTEYKKSPKEKKEVEWVYTK